MTAVDASAGLALRAVSAGYGRRQVLSRLDLHVAPGEIVAVVGPNGVGKTTLLDVVTGLQPATSGAISWRGRRIDRLPAHRRAALGIARTFQHDATFSSLDVRAHLRLGRGAGTELADLFGLPLRTLASDLEFADRRRLDLARALARGPSLLLLDEPSAGLSKRDLTALTRALDGLAVPPAVMMVEHSPHWVDAMADRVFSMRVSAAAVQPAGGGTPTKAPSGPVVLYVGAETPIRAGEFREAPTGRIRAAAGRRVIILGPDRGLIAGLTLREQWWLAAGRRPSDASVDRVRATLPGLPADDRQRVGTLSGGERTLVAVAAATFARPDAVVLEDPYRGLSDESRISVRLTLKALADQGTAVVLSTVSEPSMMCADAH